MKDLLFIFQLVDFVKPFAVQWTFMAAIFQELLLSIISWRCTVQIKEILTYLWC
jgi:hypothetical protein